MVGKALALMVVVAVVGLALGVAGLLGPSLAGADRHSATRSFSETSVPPGGEIVVEITAKDLGFAGTVKETLPVGFVYESHTGEDIDVEEDGQTITFFVFNFESVNPYVFTYTVTVSDMAGAYTFTGVTGDFNRDERQIGGATDITVEAATGTPMPSATRSFSETSEGRGDEVVVTITAMNYGVLGAVVETLPVGFTYVTSSLDDVQEEGRKLTFALIGENETFTYTVAASSVAGAYTFSGELTDDQGMPHTIGASSVTVRAPSPPRPPRPPANRPPIFSTNTATRLVAENSAAGTNVGAPVRATDADRDTLRYSLAGTDAGSFTINSGGQIMVGTGTMLDYETQVNYTVTVGATDPDNDSDTIAVTITVGNVDDPGMVTITPDTTPQVGTELTASLEDQDGSVVNLTWQWQKDDGQGSYTDILGATMMSYTPVMADEDSRLQATAMYADNHGAGKTAMGMTGSAVGATPMTGGVLARYDADNSGDIQKPEYLEALTDYILDNIDKDTYLEVLTLYILSP